METDLTKRMKYLTHSYRPKLNTSLRTIRWADEVWTPTGIVDSIRFEDYYANEEYLCRLIDANRYSETQQQISAYVIAKGLSEDGIPTIRNAEKWQDSVVKEILQNPIYTGDLLLQKTFTTEVVPFKRKTNKGQLPQYFISENHEPIITREQFEAVKEIYKYRRKQMGIDDSGKYQNRYAFSSNIVCGECGDIFRRQKIYIGKPYEKIQWCCSQHIEDKSKCSVKGICSLNQGLL